MSQIQVPVFVVEDTDAAPLPLEEPKRKSITKRRDSLAVPNATIHAPAVLKTQRLFPQEEQDITTMLQEMLANSYKPLSQDVNQYQQDVSKQMLDRLKRNDRLLPQNWHDDGFKKRPVSGDSEYHDGKLSRLNKLKSLLTDHRSSKEDESATHQHRRSIFPTKGFTRRTSLTGSVGDPQSMMELGLVYYQPQKPIIVDETNLNSVLPPISVKEKYRNFKPKTNPVLTFINSPGVLEVDSELDGSKPIEEKPKKVEEPREKPGLKVQSNQQGLRNPRFVDPNERTLLVEPAEVLFDDYIPYQVFHKKMIVKNGSKHSHRYRVTFDPPGEYPEFFELSCPNTPVNYDGLIAPGLSVEYVITFRPNSYASTTEKLIVRSEIGEETVVPIVACREPPLLTLPPLINVGNCLDNKELSYTHTITNNGGDARFIVMSPNVPLGPFELFEELGPKNDAEPKPLTFGTFRIYPSYFRLKKGGSMNLRITYSPIPFGLQKNAKKDGRKVDSQLIKIACDNCTTMDLNITGTALQPLIKVLSASITKDSNEIYPRPSTGKGNATIEPFEIDFGLENFGVPKMAILRVKNPLDIEIPFHWKYFDIKGQGQDQLRKKFAISPSVGILHPLSEMEFKMCFISDMPKKRTITAEIYASEDENTKKDLKSTLKNALIARLNLTGEAIPYEAYVNTNCIFIPNGIHSGDTFVQKISFTNASLSELGYRWEFYGFDCDNIDVHITDPVGTINARSCISLNVSITGLFPGKVKGELRCWTANGVGPTLIVSIVGKIVFKPGVLSLSVDYLDLGLVPLGMIKKVTVPLLNSSLVTMKWIASIQLRNDPSKDSLFIVYPPEGMLNPGESQNLIITFIPLWYQHFRATLLLHTRGSNDEKVLISATDVMGTSLTPRLVVENPVNSLACFVDVPFSYKVSLKNTRSLPASYNWQSKTTDLYVVDFDCSQGVVPPNETCEILVKLTFFKSGAYDINLSGSVDSMVEDFGQLNISVSVDAVESFFSFHVVENEVAWDARKVIPRIHPPRQDSDANLRIDFGLACPIFVVRTRTVKIRNHSAMACPFQTTVHHFPAMDDEEETIKDQGYSRSNLGSAHHSKTPKLLQDTVEPQFGFSSKAGQAFVDGLNSFRGTIERMKRILSHGKGVAFRAYPSSGIIPPWGEVEIRIYSYNNLVGIYEDTLTCKVGKIVRELPIRMGVIGSTVKFTGPQLVALRDDNRGEMKFDLVNFGSRVINPALGDSNGIQLISKTSARRKTQTLLSKKEVDYPTKNVTVENHSPREIRLEWSVFVKHHDVNQKTLVTVEDTTLQIEQDESKLSDIFRSENQLRKGAVGLLDVSPAVMVIPPFKSATLTCNFRNCKVGSFEALVLADVAYGSEEGYVFSPQRSKVPGELPKRQAVLKSDTCYDTLTVDDLVSVAKLRIKGKCIEPKLSLDVGNKIRIKKNLRPGAVEEDQLKTISFLVNDSDAVCDFWIDANPKQAFHIQASKSFIKQTKTGHIYELKQKQHMMITVKFVGETEHVNYFPSGFLPTLSPQQSLPNSRPSSSNQYLVAQMGERERQLSVIESLRGKTPSLSLTPQVKQFHQEILSALPSDVDMILPNTGTTLSTPGLLGPATLATGHVTIHFSNGMTQTIPIVVEGVYE